MGAFDNLNEKNQLIIDNTKNKKIIDLGQYFELEKMSDDEILNYVTNNKECSNYLNRFSFSVIVVL